MFFGAPRGDLRPHPSHEGSLGFTHFLWIKTRQEVKGKDGSRRFKLIHARNQLIKIDAVFGIFGVFLGVRARPRSFGANACTVFSIIT